MTIEQAGERIGYTFVTLIIPVLIGLWLGKKFMNKENNEADLTK